MPIVASNGREICAWLSTATVSDGADRKIGTIVSAILCTPRPEGERSALATSCLGRSVVKYLRYGMRLVNVSDGPTPAQASNSRSFRHPK
jgi:hypothetical protein